MRPYIPNLRAIEVKYYGPTDTRGARVRLRDFRGILRDRWLPYSYGGATSPALAREFLESEGWTLAHGAETPDAFLWLSPDFGRDSWTAPEPQEAAQ
jgi:hypothetical protein